jgi:hypothetical protein
MIKRTRSILHGTVYAGDKILFTDKVDHSNAKLFRLAGKRIQAINRVAAFDYVMEQRRIGNFKSSVNQIIE